MAAAAAPAGVDVSDIGGISVYHNYEHHLQSVPAASHPEPFLLRRWLSEHAGGREQRSFVYQRGCQFPAGAHGAAALLSCTARAER